MRSVDAWRCILRNIRNPVGTSPKKNNQSAMPMLVSIVVCGMATFMVNPLLALELMRRGETAGQAGVVLGVLSGAGLMCSGIIGMINARFGSKPITVIGLVLRAAGMAVFLFDASTAAYVAFAAIASLGSAGANLGVKTELMRQSTDRRLVTMRSIAVNSGALIGPAAGAGLYLLLDFDAILVIVQAAYVLLAVALLFLPFQPPEDRTGRPVQPVRSDGGRRQTRDYGFALILVLTMMYWLIYSQWSLVVPMSASAGFGTDAGSNAIYIGNAVLILAVQYPLLVHGLKHAQDTSILFGGFLSFVPAFVLLALPPSVAVPIGFGLLFSLGELLISPTLDVVTGKVRRSGNGLTRAYGWTSAASGISSIVGSSMGGTLIDWCGGVQGSMALCLPAACVAFVTIILLRERSESL